MRKNFIIVILFLCFLKSQDTSKSLQNIQWSGISYINPNIEITEKYPNFSILEPYLRKLITKKINSIDGLKYNLQTNPSGSLNDGSLAMLLAVESETVTKLEINILNKPSCISTYYIAMQLIIFDPSNSSILQIIPISAKRIYPDEKKGTCDSTTSNLDLFRFAQFMLNLDIDDQDEIDKYSLLNSHDMITSLISLSDSNESLTSNGSYFYPFFSKLKEIDFDKIKNTKFFVGVSDVEIEPLALEQISGKKELKENKYFISSNEFNSNSYKIWLGQQYVKWFASELNYPLVPYIKGRALGKDLALKFSDSTELLNLSLPDLDWGFKIKIRGFKKVLLDESRGREAFGWASFGNITFQSVGFKDYNSINVKHVITKEVNRGDKVDDWVNFDNSTNSFLLNYIKNIKSVDKKWVSENTNLKNKDFIKFSKLVYEKLKL